MLTLILNFLLHGPRSKCYASPVIADGNGFDLFEIFSKDRHLLSLKHREWAIGHFGTSHNIMLDKNSEFVKGQHKLPGANSRSNLQPA